MKSHFMISPFSNVVSSLQQPSAFTEERIKPKAEFQQYFKRLGLPLLLAIIILYPMHTKKQLTNNLHLDFALPNGAMTNPRKISL